MKRKNKSGGAAAIMAVFMFVLMFSGCDGESVREQPAEREN